MKNKISLILNIVFVIFATTFIIDSGLHRLTIYIATLLWILEGNFKEKFKQIYSQKVILLYLSMLFMFMLSLVFSDSFSNGFFENKYATGYEFIFKKLFFYFLMAIYISTSLKKEFIKYVIYGFLFQVFIMIIVSFGIKFGIIEGNVNNPVSFISTGNHIQFSLILNIGLIFAIYLFHVSSSKLEKILFLFFAIFILVDIFLVQSRTGYLISLLILFIWIFMLGKKIYRNKAFLFGIVFIVAIFAVNVFFNINFKNRVNQAFSNIIYALNKKDYTSSLGIRIGLNIASFDLLTNSYTNFIFGLGMGDAQKKFKEYVNKNFNSSNRNALVNVDHTHNQFFQVWIDGGILALLCYILIFFALYKLNLTYYQKFVFLAFFLAFLIFSISGVIFLRVIIISLFSLCVGLLLAMDRENTINILNK